MHRRAHAAASRPARRAIGKNRPHARGIAIPNRVASRVEPREILVCGRVQDVAALHAREEALRGRRFGARRSAPSEPSRERNADEINAPLRRAGSDNAARRPQPAQRAWRHGSLLRRPLSRSGFRKALLPNSCRRWLARLPCPRTRFRLQHRTVSSHLIGRGSGDCVGDVPAQPDNRRIDAVGPQVLCDRRV